MKKISIALFIITLFLQACSNKISYVQVFKTEATNSKKANNSYIFENDTLRITYYFWEEKGTMAFRIYNKSDKPLYLDWKKSNYISNAFKSDYWVDKTTVNTSWLASSAASKSSKTNLDSYTSISSNQTTTIGEE